MPQQPPLTSLSATEPTLALYRAAAAAGAIGAPAQTRYGSASWIRATAADIVFAVFSRDGRAALLLALEVIGRGPFRVARFIGGSHANGNFPLCSRSSHPIDAGEIAALIGALAKIRPDIDLLSCERMLPQLGGAANPLLLLPATPSPNLSLAVDTGGGFDALLGRTSGKRKRKKHRVGRRASSRRPAASAGSRRPPEPRPNALLDAFFAMKEVRFRKMGIANVFGEPPRCRPSSAASSPERWTRAEADFVLHGLEVGGKIRAVTGSQPRGDSLICEFGAIAEDELAFASPGEFLFFDNIREACEQGFRALRFQRRRRALQAALVRRGDPPVRRAGAADGQGQGLGRSTALTSRLKRFVKNTPALWAAARRLRRRAAGQPEGCGDD